MANGTFWWPIGLLAGVGALAGLAARRGGRLRRALAALTGRGGVRADRRRDAPRSAHASGSCSRRGAPITSWRRSGPPTPSGRSWSCPITTPRIRPSSSTRRSPRRSARTPPGSSRTTTPARPLMWPVVAGPAIVAAGAALGSRGLTGLGTSSRPAAPRSWRTSVRARSCPAPTTTAPAASPQLALARAFSERPPEKTRILFLSTSEEALCEGMGLFMERHAHELPRRADLLPLPRDGRVAEPARAARRGHAEAARVPGRVARAAGLGRGAARHRADAQPAASQRHGRGLPARRRLPVRLGRPPATSGRTRRTTTGRRTRRRTSTTTRSPMRSALRGGHPQTGRALGGRLSRRPYSGVAHRTTASSSPP